MADDAQPDMGQGESGSGLFDQYLQDVPQDARQYVENYLSDAAKNVNSRLEEAATLRSTYEPFSQVPGLNQYDTNSLGQLVQWHQQVSSDPAAYEQFLRDEAKERGWAFADQPEPEVPELTPDLARQYAQETVAPLQQQLEAMQLQTFIDTEANLIRQRFEQFESENKVTLDEEQRQWIVKLASDLEEDDDPNLTYTNGQDWLAPGFNAYQKLVAAGAKGMVDDLSNQPPKAVESGGTGVFELPRTFAEASERAKERLRKSRS